MPAPGSSASYGITILDDILGTTQKTERNDGKSNSLTDPTKSESGIEATSYTSSIRMLQELEKTDSFLAMARKEPLIPTLTEPFRILCTSDRQMMGLGSFRIRCMDFRTYCALYFPNVTIDINQVEGVQYNATVFVKSVPKKFKPEYGATFIDIVDHITFFKAVKGNGNKKIKRAFLQSQGVLVQNEPMGLLFRKHRPHIVTHWFNSFPADDREAPVGPLPEIKELHDDDGVLRVATVWDSAKGCPTNSNATGIEYQCISEPYNIWHWYHKYETNGNIDQIKRAAKQIKQKPELGEGYLYRLLFRQFHVLVVFPKAGFKLKYHNYQRVLSQMRSGVPVLFDCRGLHHRHFCERYPEYARHCTFDSDKTLWQKLEQMKSAELRTKCQLEGLEITKDFTPKNIVKTYLTVLGLFNESNVVEPQPYLPSRNLATPPKNPQSSASTIQSPSTTVRVDSLSNGTAVICCIMKNEQLYLQEWLDYNFALGFDHMYMYDNSDDNNLKSWFEETEDAQQYRDRITLIPYSGSKMQRPAYRDCGARIKEKNHTWVYYADSDEFLVLKKHRHIQEFCADRVERGHTAVNWLTFGTSGQDQYVPLPMTFRFQCRPKISYPMNRMFKSIIRVIDLDHKKIYGPHMFPRLNKEKVHLTNGRVIKSSGIRGPTDTAQIYHYYFKSLDEYVKKRTRGGTLHGISSKAGEQAKAGFDIYGLPIPLGETRDSLAWEQFKQLVPKYAEYENHPMAHNLTRSCWNKQ